MYYCTVLKTKGIWSYSFFIDHTSIRMKKLKDFFYNKNDILVVLIILAAAAFIIYTRIGVILDYPEKLAKEAAATETTQAVAESTESSVVSVTIEDSDTSDTVSRKLYDKALVASASDFKAYIDEQSETVTFKTGTFQIPKDSSDEEILDIITE